MRVTCTSCGKQLTIPDERVPPRPFAITCRGCGTKQQVDPTIVTADDADDDDASPPRAGDAFAPLPALRHQDRELLSRLVPEAWVVDATGVLADPLEAALRHLGMDEIRRFGELAEAAAALAENEVGVLVVALGKVEPPPCPPLAPLHAVPQDLRRRIFVALVGDNVRSLDGQVAFLLQVNCLLAAADLPKAPRLLRRALLHHLRLYRHWDEALTAGT